MPRSQSGRSLETLSAARRYATRRSLHERFSGKKTKLLILLTLFAHRAGERVSTKHHVETGNRGVSRSHHRRLTDLPLKTMECANYFPLSAITDRFNACNQFIHSRATRWVTRRVAYLGNQPLPVR